MAYQVPSTQVYQQFANAGGVASVTPDLPVVIVGPAYNVVDYNENPDLAYAATVVGSTVDGSVSLALPSPIVGQDVDEDSLEVRATRIIGYILKDAEFTATAGDNVITYSGADQVDFTKGSKMVPVGTQVNVSYGDDSSFTTRVSSVGPADTKQLFVADKLPSDIADGETLTVSLSVDFSQTSRSDSRTIAANAVTLDTSASTVTLQASVFEDVVSAEIYISYRALRQDLEDIIALESSDDIEGRLGVSNPSNPAALASTLALAGAALANGNIYFKAVRSNDLRGYTEALEELENQMVYSVVPLTQDIDILTAVATHVRTMSTPEARSWRVALVSTAIPKNQNVGAASELNPITGELAENPSGPGFLLTSDSSSFVSDGVAPGDNVEVVNSATPSNQGTFEVTSVRTNQELVISGSLTADSNMEFFVYRRLSKTQQADTVVGNSEAFNSRRVLNVQPTEVIVGSETVPGYYACAVLGGMIAGYPVQQNFTNITVPGLSNLRYSNFYFSRADMNKMAAAGTLLMVQETQGGAPYIRHSLTTDLSTVNTQELLITKNLDYLSYQYMTILDRFIGSYNITTDTLNAMRQDIVSTSELLKAAVQPKIGPPLLDYEITKLEQNPDSKDRVTIRMNVSTVYPDNYNDLYLVI